MPLDPVATEMLTFQKHSGYLLQAYIYIIVCTSVLPPKVITMHHTEGYIPVVTQEILIKIIVFECYYK